MLASAEVDQPLPADPRRIPRPRAAGARGDLECLGRLRAPRGQTILVIDKYIERLVKLADRHTIIERGRVAWQGSSRELDADRNLWHRYLGV